MCKRTDTLQLKNEWGQSTVEFALTLILLLAFVLFFFQLSLVFAWGNYVHYATFMSARAYLSSGLDESDQRDRARAVIVQMLKRSAGMSGIDKFPTIAKGVGGSDVPGFEVDSPAQYKPHDRSYSWMQGVRYTFKSKLFMIPFAGSKRGSLNSVTLTSESWLGREATSQECQQDMGRQNWIFDNGC